MAKRSWARIAKAYKIALNDLIEALDDCRSFDVEFGCNGEGAIVEACRAIRKPLPPNLREWFEEGRRHD